MTFTCNEKIKRWASSPPQVSQVKSRICTQVKIRRGGMGLTLQFPSWANCSSKSSTSTVPNCLIMFDIFFADLDMRIIFWHVLDCLGYFDPSHPGVQCRVPQFHLGRVPQFHLGHVRGSHLGGQHPQRRAKCRQGPWSFGTWKHQLGRAEAVNGGRNFSIGTAFLIIFVGIMFIETTSKCTVIICNCQTIESTNSTVLQQHEAAADPSVACSPAPKSGRER